MSEKLIVLFDHPHDRYGLEDGIALHASGEHFEELLFAYKHDATKFPIQETVQGGARLMIWEGQRQRDCQWDSDEDPYFIGAWRPATGLDLIDADLLGGLE